MTTKIFHMPTPSPLQTITPVHTTPKSPTRFNALKHGLYARDVVLPGKDRGAYDAVFIRRPGRRRPTWRR